jgi:TM2 domain containing protein
MYVLHVINLSEDFMNYCFNCGKKVNEVQDVCLNCGVNLRKNKKIDNVNGKSKITAGILGIFLGCYGVHNFYLGYNGKAIAQLLITLLSLFLLSWVSAIWGLIEGILILTGNIKKDASGNDLID